jgi:hypothetical protein
MWDTADCRSLLADLERTPRRVQLHHAELETMTAWCMDEIYRLAKSAKHKERKMELVGLEYRARLLLERWKKRDQN